MKDDELIEALRKMDKKRVEQLDEKTRNLFYAIMKIADANDELKAMYEFEQKLVTANELRIMELEEKLRGVK